MPTGQIDPNDDDYRENDDDDDYRDEFDDDNDEDEDDGIEVVVDADEEEEGKQHTGFKIADAGGCPPFFVA